MEQYYRLIQRRDTAANWTAANPVLEAGEWGYETDTKKIKMGDGTTLWNSLPYFEGGSGGSTAWADITGKPNFATVATSGSYNDLTNRPTIPTQPNNGRLTIHVDGEEYIFSADSEEDVDIDITTGGSTAWADITGKPNFATVATSGNYNDLSNRPTIPTYQPGTAIDIEGTTVNVIFGELGDEEKAVSGAYLQEVVGNINDILDTI